MVYHIRIGIPLFISLLCVVGEALPKSKEPGYW